MTVVKSVSDGLRDCESETQLNLNLPLRISPGPRHLSRPLAVISTYADDRSFIVLTETKFIDKDLGEILRGRVKFS